MVERVLGKDEVTGSIPVNGSRFSTRFRQDLSSRFERERLDVSAAEIGRSTFLFRI
jgi:hypothetical protein